MFELSSLTAGGVYLPVFAFIAGLVAFVAFVPLSRFVPQPVSGSRFLAIDGLRGYLALAVLVHHSSIWYVYARTGKWSAPPSALYAQLGEAAVAMFFMISSFLFYRMVIDSAGVDWLRLYVGRFLRMFPLFLVSFFVLLALIFYSSGFLLVEAPVALGMKVIQWLSFTVLGAPDINGVVGTRYIMAGVVWSLPYEWVWYGALPLIAMLVGSRPSKRILLISALALLYAALRLELLLLLPFAGGIVGLHACRSPRISAALRQSWATLLAIACAVSSVVFFESARHPAAVILWTFVFSSIACGNDFFGVLSNKVSVAMGEVSYGIYLFHGFYLFGAFELLGRSAYTALSPTQHWLVTFCLIPVLLITCVVAYRVVELPAMLSRSRVMEALGHARGYLCGMARRVVPGRA
ncbi:acyltransferase [Stenotrophomonas sp. TWI1151]|uniref:acyltransferase family protein n=1 Tax=Stenotrophomonas sp. TWI1151 TaxID=3136798 RepID=UPI00320808F4